MLIVLSIYAVLIWLLFFKAKILPWNQGWKWTVYSVGVLIALVVLGALNYYTPSGRIVVQGAIVEITPNVSGTVVSVEAKPNLRLKKGDVIFRIDPTPFAAEVRRLEAALVDARENVRRMEADLASARADVAALEAQGAFARRRVADIQQLQSRGATTEFKVQEAVTQLDSLVAQRDSAAARARSLEIALASRVGEVHSSVAQIDAQLDRAFWELEQTTVRASSDGMVTVLTLRSGARVSPVRSVAAFVPVEDLALTGVFPQAGLSRIQEGTSVSVAFAADPGSIYESTVILVVPAVGEGQVTATGALPRAAEFLRGGGSDTVVRIAMPTDVPERVRQLGVAGTATVFAENSGPMEPLARILLWLRAFTNFL
jgi:multidrug resistance efflux pump